MLERITNGIVWLLLEGISKLGGNNYGKQFGKGKPRFNI